MGIMSRFARICRADIHGVMDSLEDKELMLRQHLREMEDELEQKESRLRGLLSAMEEATADRKRHRAESERIDKDIATAITRDNDDAARSLIRRQRTLRNHLESLDQHLETLGRDSETLGRCVSEQRLILEQTRLRSEEFFRASQAERWNNIIGNTTMTHFDKSEVEMELELRKETLKTAEAK